MPLLASPGVAHRVEAPPSGDPRHFRCTGCGDCCRIHRVPLTAKDLSRLSAALEGSPARFVEWLAPDEVDMTGEPESFVVLPGGERLPVLLHRGGACVFLDADDRCSVYDARPTSCRTFPLELEPAPAAEAEPGKRRLTLLVDAACPGAFDGKDGSERAIELLEQRRRELELHTTRVLAWNRHQWRRRFVRAPLEDRDAFLTFLLRRTTERP